MANQSTIGTASSGKHILACAFRQSKEHHQNEDREPESIRSAEQVTQEPDDGNDAKKTENNDEGADGEDRSTA